MSDYLNSFRERLEQFSLACDRIDELDVDSLAALRDEAKYLTTVFAAGPRFFREARQLIHQRVQMIQSQDKDPLTE